MSDLPEIRPHALAPADGLAGALLGDGELARRLLPAGAVGPEEKPGGGGGTGGGARLPSEAFGAAGPAAEARLDRILRGDGVFVTTGQQPLLFLGPLFVLYKVFSALELARRLERTTGRPALALFWVGSDDHDWPEVGRTRLIDAENRLRELRLEPPDGWEARPTGLAPLPASVASRLQELDEFLPNTEFKDLYLGLFRDTWKPGRPLGDAFGRSLSALLPERPLVWLDAGSPALKRAAVPLFRAALEEAGPGERAVAEGARRLRALGFEAPIPPLPGGTHLFYDTGAERSRLYREGPRIRVGREGRDRPLEEVLEEVEAAPERFGPNVALRPVLESWLLPVGATVIGPGELAYWSQLPDLFALHGVRMPALRPRHAWLLIETKVRKVLDKLGEGPEAFAEGPDAVVGRAVREARPAALETALAGFRSAIGRALADVEEAVAAELPGIRSAVGKARSQAFRAAQELEEQVDGRLREEREVLLEQVEKAALHLYPGREPQERVQSPLYYLVRYGSALLAALERRAAELTPPLWPEG